MTLGRIMSVAVMTALMTNAAFGSEPLTQDVRFTGYAKDPKNGDLLYQEQHTIVYSVSGERLSSEVQYLTPTGDVFAEKSLKYGQHPTLPTMEFFDHRFAQTIKVQKQDDHVLVESILNGEKTKQDVDDQSSLPLVADAGFDMFMVQNWSTLLKGQTHTIDFLAITRGQFIEFDIKKLSETDNTVSFELKPSSFLISMLVDPILLTYDKSSANILYYRGLTNIEKAEPTDNGWLATGDNHVAVIEYQYETRVSYLQTIKE